VQRIPAMLAGMAFGYIATESTCAWNEKLDRNAYFEELSIICGTIISYSCVMAIRKIWSHLRRASSTPSTEINRLTISVSVQYSSPPYCQLEGASDAKKESIHTYIHTYGVDS
jgi:hypothetical protein